MPKDTFFHLNEGKQETIIRAAVNEFLKQGFESGNIGTIAKNAGVAKGSMYQYFENKKELFLYTVQWASNYFFQKYNATAFPVDMDLFDFLFESSKQILQQLREEKELALFVQDVFMSRYINMTDESINVMLKASDESVLRLIRQGKQNGSIRTDMDDRLLCLFLTGATTKIKQNILDKARTSGIDVTDERLEKYEDEIKAMLELLKNGMGSQNHFGK